MAHLYASCSGIYFIKTINFHTVAVTSDHVTSSGPRRRPDSGDRACVVCSQPHRLFQCELYKGMQPVDRFQVAKRHKLRCLCLLAGHVSNVCYKQSMCTVPNFSRKHSSLFHTDTVDDDNVVHEDVLQVNDSIQVCGNCNSWIQFESSGYGKAWAETRGKSFACKGCTEVTALLKEVEGLRQMVEDIMEKVARLRFEDKGAVTECRVTKTGGNQDRDEAAENIRTEEH